MAEVFEFKKVGKTTITLDGKFLRIKRKGALNLLNHGLDGEKSINIEDMSGIQLKNASLMTNGYIQLIIKGSKESKGGLFAATKDENTIMFAKKEQQMADKIKDYVENILANKNNPISITPQIDQAEELRKFKALLDDGIISEEEFHQKKKQLLGV